MKKRVPIGVSDFKELILEEYYYIDKSLLIKEVIDHGSKVILLPRPRRFGKTLNLSMLRYFYEQTTEDTSHLFQKLAINKQGEQYMGKQGQHPVIFLTFKDITGSSWDECYSELIRVIANEFLRHDYLLSSGKLKPMEAKEYEQITALTANFSSYKNSLKQLSAYLERFYGHKTVILIDEYDIPIQQGYLYQYYDEAIGFVRPFLSGGLKDNTSLEQGILTGILHVAKESIFSGLNNLEVCTLLHHAFSQHFGLLETEVEALMAYYEIDCKLDEIKKWYNGYIFGSTVIYNPWSILNYAKNWREGFLPYWVNTSNNDLIKQMLTQSSGEIKEDLERLLRGEHIRKRIDDNIVLRDIEHHADALWSFLLFSGYMKIVSKEQGKRLYGKLTIPNIEVEGLYEDMIMGWINPITKPYHTMLDSLTKGDVDTFAELFREVTRTTFSTFDTSGKEPEKVYHAFVLGLLVHLQDHYIVQSNRESGYGRYDVMLIPKEKNRLGIIIEFKKVRVNESLQDAVTAALAQIEAKQYATELHAHGIEQILKIGIAFAGKKVEIAAENR